MKILRIDMSTQTSSFEDLPDDWKILGGRGLSAKILNKEVPPDSDPLGAEARLILANGPLAGTNAPSFGRMSVGAKSPLTKGIKEANVGGILSQQLDKLGIRAIVVQGAPSDGKIYLAKINKDGVSIEDAEAFRGMGTYSMFPAMREEHGKKLGIIAIGPVGENKNKAASVALSDKDGHPSRHAARGGVGAVMGAKGLKAILVDDSDAAIVAPIQRDAYFEALKPWNKILDNDPQIKNVFSATGTPGVLEPLSGMGSTPMKNYSGESFEGIEGLYGTNIREEGDKRGGKMDACMPGCMVKCSVVHHDKEGEHVTSALEYETLALMGSNLGVGDADDVAGFDRKCDDLGADTIEIGSALGIAASVGKFEWGDAAAIDSLLDEVGKGTGLGATIADGVVATAAALGVNRVPAFKGQAIPAHDPRVGKPTGVTYATSPMGADHTAGLKYELGDEGAVEHSLQEQIWNAALDALGLCEFAVPGDRTQTMTFVKDLLNACYDLELTADDMVNLGRDTLRDEIEFNKGAEIADFDPVPDFVRSEVLPPMGLVFGVDQKDITKIWDNLDTVAVL
ncbi:MAG: aldehyde ferredoxin oxidoreductase N-terminal domain-containing protein [Pseudomonadales bacterium]|jgi:aldehyde:ferredoxin oxidoreductase|nr:aldehyde ferredoxin oxidoreductase [Gammaproteobacteria bacterium]MDP6028047.1 aldehyde ferredoxin oxidoreductase N-terminal domain-containing protein [Pseudomonadales bacterium]MDP6316198.1 aldehyde ferredoxin oxidoreductase N-terminal domain-containing protein [Pseudomonadales bacterium]MDP7316179.1 aldehyde ferredoxin oxidoreductase N-terminal domain-containing protein [Pseudomonadales bacterium]MDP7575788.1 aldehyde ferredoxin oxidoreductase N-terminal domain-containing protein [Pseudomo|tara:strand:+ start:8202 stop:9902 length:1701 start_codon:yes stop_codon:yes gene_type:complete